METSATNLQYLPFHVLIPAAGIGSRIGGDMPKQYQKIYGKAILRHTIEKFIHCPGFKSLSVIIQPEHKPLYDDAVIGLNLAPVVYGGGTRYISVFNGLKSLSDIEDQSVVLIHDAVRPMVSQKEILSLISTLKDSQAATLATPIVDTLRRSKSQFGETVDRDGLWSIQTPQAFRFSVLMNAYQQADKKDKDYTDESSLVSAMGQEVTLVKGHHKNIKITTPEDIEIAQSLLSTCYEFETRTAFGYDVHAFDDKGTYVKLCGVKVPFKRSLKGHSDADVGLHAITDALLGTICYGDIGSHFPPTESQWLDANSSIFLNHAVSLIKERGGKILLIDLTLICESPKIAPYRNEMKKRIAQICNISEDRISVKATTTEGLGFTGKGKGIAAQALATISIPIG